MNEFMQGDWPTIFLWKHVWNGCIQGTVAMLLVFAAYRLFQRISPSAGNWLCRLGYLKLLVAFIFLGSIGLPVLRHAPVKTPSVVISKVLMSSHAHALIPVAVHPAVHSYALCLLMKIWCFGLILFGVRIGIASYMTRTLRQSCRLLQDEGLQAEVTSLCRLMRIGRVPELLIGNVSGPLICGFVTPSIIFPESTITDQDRDDLRLVLAHELAHIKRHDVAWAWLPLLAQWFFFFHPLVWLLRGECLFTQEAACDALALEITSASPVQYGRMLLEHSGRVAGAKPLVAIGVGEQYETLKRRLNVIRSAHRTRKNRLIVGVVIGVFALAGVVPWTIHAISRPSPETERVANILPKVIFSEDVNAFKSLFPYDPKRYMSQADWDVHISDTVKYLSSNVQSYGPVKTIALEANDRILPGLSGKGMMLTQSGDDRRQFSTWRVQTEQDEYRLGIVMHDGRISALVLNLADGSHGTGVF